MFGHFSTLCMIGLSKSLTHLANIACASADILSGLLLLDCTSSDGCVEPCMTLARTTGLADGFLVKFMSPTVTTLPRS